jgi:hypothetical protein
VDRNHTAPFQKKGPRAEREVQRDAMAMVEQNCEKFVREKMKPQLVQSAKQALAAFRRRS